MVADANPHRELRYVPPDSLRDYWEMIRPGLERVKESGKENWLIEDIYAAIKSNNATLHVGYVASQYVGFVVLCPNKSWGLQMLHIWCLYLESSAKTENTDAMIDFWPELVKMAQNIGARQIVMDTARNGFERRLAGLGFKVNKLQMGCEV